MISESCEAWEEGTRIAKAIQNTFNNNWRFSFPRRHDDRVKGYYCYEWAYAFEDAYGLEASGKYFTVKVTGASTLEGLIHAWVKITSLETGESVYVDDGFWDGTYVHDAAPRATPYDFDWFPSDSPRKEANVPSPYDSKGKKH